MSRVEREVAGAQLAELVHAQRSTTEAVARLGGQIVNGVLSCELITIPADGVVTREWGAAYGSVALTHHGPSTGAVLVAAGGPIGDVRPSGGPTIGRLDAKSSATFALVGHQLTIWGTAGDLLTLQVFTGCVPPAFATKA